MDQYCETFFKISVKSSQKVILKVCSTESEGYLLLNTSTVCVWFIVPKKLNANERPRILEGNYKRIWLTCPSLTVWVILRLSSGALTTEGHEHTFSTPENLMLVGHI